MDCTERIRPVRVSVDLPPDEYTALRRYAFDAGMTHAGVVRALIGLLDDDDISRRVCGEDE